MSDTYHVHDRLDDYVDGLLSEREHDAVRRHLEECAACGAEAEAIRELQAAARSLPREIAPPRELWSGIAARLQSESRPPIRVDFRRPATPWRRWAGAAAAAVALVAVSSGVTAHLMRAGESQVAAVSTLPATEVRTGVTALAGFRPAEAEFIASVDALERELEARRGQLAPETVAIVEANLRIIDQAIAESRAALLADPANSELPHHLTEVYRQKVQLLQRAVQLPVVRT